MKQTTPGSVLSGSFKNNYSDKRETCDEATPEATPEAALEAARLMEVEK